MEYDRFLLGFRALFQLHLRRWVIPANDSRKILCWPQLVMETISDIYTCSPWKEYTWKRGMNFTSVSYIDLIAFRCERADNMLHVPVEDETTPWFWYSQYWYYVFIYIYITIVMAIISNTQKTLKQYVWLPNFVFNYLIDIWRCNDVIPLGTSKTCKIHWNNFCSLKFHQGDKLMVWGKVSW